jgi:hypothetical protein
MRTFDPTVHNVIANHPDTIKGLHWHGEGFLTFDNLCEDPENYFLLHNGSREFTVEEVANGTLPAAFPTLGIIGEWSAPGVVEIHTMSLPHARGNLINDAKKLIHELFVDHGFDMIWGRTPFANPIAQAFNAKVGAVSCGEGHHPIAGHVAYFRNSRARWLRDHWSQPLR